MPKKDELLQFLQAEHHMGVLLMIQMGGTPEELQCIVQTAVYDEQAQGLRERKAYIVRALGVKEHRVSLGIFSQMFIAAEHPILYHHNAALYDLHFEGAPKDANALVLDIQAAYSATFGPWRDLAEDINREKPLFDLVQSNTGRLGTFPEPAAQRLVRVLSHHEMRATLHEREGVRSADDEKMRAFEQDLKLLGMDDSYIIAYAFSVEEMTARR